MKYNYDQVAVQKAGGGFNLMSAEEFNSIELEERIKLLTSGKCEFIRAGTVISTAEAFRKVSDSSQQKESA